MIHLLLYLFLILFLLLGLAITLVTLPGLWLMLASSAAYAWLTKWQFMGWKTLLVLLALAILGEVVEIGFQAGGARRSGGGRRGTWGALIGGVLGGIFLSFIPIFVVGTIVGICLGTFFGALIGELSGGRELGRSAIIGATAVGGRVTGMLAKLGIGTVMLAITLWMALPVHFR